MHDRDAHQLRDLNFFDIVVASTVRHDCNNHFVQRNGKCNRNPQSATIVVLAENREEPSAFGG